jgi:hypothetical protein
VERCATCAQSTFSITYIDGGGVSEHTGSNAHFVLLHRYGDVSPLRRTLERRICHRSTLPDMLAGQSKGQGLADA